MTSYRHDALHFVVIATTAFLTLVDLFAAQAILPFLAAAYKVSAAAMSFAVNASTIGMAAGGLGVALFSARIDRRLGILCALGVLAVPTLLLSLLPALPIFTILRIVQGLCMSSAFALTLAYLGEHESPSRAAVAFAAYVTGNVASNLVGRMISAGVADHFGLAANFQVFALLNVAGAVLVWFTIEATPRAITRSMTGMRAAGSWLAQLRDQRLLAAFGIGFCLLFAFIGTFTFVNFVLVGPPLDLGMMQVGFVYLVFLPAILTTPLAGSFVARFGTRPALWGALAVALLGLPFLVSPHLRAVLTGMVLVSAGTFFAQAIATGFVSRTAETDRAAASGVYLASYFAGGLAGSVVLGLLFDRAGWSACVMGIAGALLLACALTIRLRAAASRPAIASLT
ncbi:MAG TPA: MFS transporter [Tepidisphaeraceae bacterium]|nr:MFS transporter [Tepidisphaeraceae bacterium]